MAGVQVKTKVTVAFVLMLDDQTPLIESGREARHTIDPSMIPDDPAEGREMFLALAHDGAVNLWGREMQSIWYPEKKTKERQPSSNGSGDS